jgi:hypothetical protein
LIIDAGEHLPAQRYRKIFQFVSELAVGRA